MARSAGGFQIHADPPLRELARELQNAADNFPRELRRGNKEAAEVVARKARTNAPVRTGRLRSSIKSQASTRSAYVKAGTASRVPYAPIIEFGWPGHNIEPQPYLYPAIESEEDRVLETYEEVLDAILRQARFR